MQYTFQLHCQDVIITNCVLTCKGRHDQGRIFSTNHKGHLHQGDKLQ